MRLEAGKMLGHCRLVEKIGEGGMGVVWKAVDTTLDREVAVKVLPEAFASDPLRLAYVWDESGDNEGIRPTIVLVQNWFAEFTSR